jgi:hypothetical protein
MGMENRKECVWFTPFYMSKSTLNVDMEEYYTNGKLS